MTDVDLDGQRVFIRSDLNVPQDGPAITDDTHPKHRFAAFRLALDSGARVMVLSHLGRPKEGEPDPEFSLEPVAESSAELLGRACRSGPVARRRRCQAGRVRAARELRFNMGEKKNDEALANVWRRSAMSS